MPVTQVSKKIDSCLQKDISRCLNDLYNDDLPWAKVKEEIVAFIQLNCKTKECMDQPSDPCEYKLENESPMLMTVAHSRHANIVYMIDATNGCVTIGFMNRMEQAQIMQYSRQEVDAVMYAFVHFSNCPAPILA
jgi:hypothetical protein